MDELNEKGSVTMVDHVLIRDKTTAQILVNKRGTPVKKFEVEKEENNERNN